MVKQHILAALAGLVMTSSLATSSTAQELSARYETRLSGGSLGIDLRLGEPRYGRRPAIRAHRPRGHHYGRRVWIPGHYTVVSRRVFVPGPAEKIWVEPLYETRYDECHQPFRVLVREGRWRVVQHPGHYEIRQERVWRPGTWSYR